MATPTKNPQLLDVAEKVGSFIEYWGFKRVHGKIWTLVFLSPEPVDANYLKDSLKISKALTSMTIKDLLFYKVILEVEKEKPGTQKYRINPDITQVIIDVINQRELKMLVEIQASSRLLSSAHKSQAQPQISSSRLGELTSMIDGAQLILQSMVAGHMVDFNAFEETMTVTQD